MDGESISLLCRSTRFDNTIHRQSGVREVVCRTGNSIIDESEKLGITTALIRSGNYTTSELIM